MNLVSLQVYNYWFLRLTKQGTSLGCFYIARLATTSIRNRNRRL